MKNILLLVSMFLITITFAYAGPASPDIFDAVQPDGTIFKARVHGDEFQSWTEAVDSGHTIIREEATSYWVYADEKPDGTLMSSGLRVDPTGRSAPVNIKPGLRPPRDDELEQQQYDSLQKIYIERLGPASAYSPGNSDISQFSTAAASGWVPQPVSGSRKILLVLVGFSDRAFQTSVASWYDAVFSTAAGVKSVANYYKDNSYGNLSITPAAHTQPGNPAGVVTVTLAQTHPNPPDSNKSLGQSTWVPAAINAVDPYVHFGSYDTNSNGLIDRSELLVYFILAGYEESASSSLTPRVWAHATSYGSGGLSAAGTVFPVFAMNGELYDATHQMPMGVIAHELGHQIGGFPDLYDTSNTNAGMGYFSLMAGGSWGRAVGETGGTTPVAHDAWTREYAGWGIPQSPVVSGPLILGAALSNASNSAKLISPSVSTTEYWLAENRHPTGWDMGLTGLMSGYGGGLLITHIDLMIGTPGAGTTGNNDFNRYGTGAHQGDVPEQASTTSCNMLAANGSSTCRGSVTTTFYSGNNTSFGVSTTPNSTYYSAHASGFELNNISVRGTTMTATAVISGTSVAVAPDAPTIGTATAGNAQATVNFTPPASNGGSAITSYTVTSSPGGITKTGTTSPITVTGLTNGTSYTFTVKATNSAGTGSSSAASNSVTPASASIISGSLTTTFAGGVYGADGNMFDVKVLSGNVTINRFDLNLYATAGTVVPMRVYYKSGSYSGYEEISTAWTLLGTYSVTSAGPGNPSSMVMGNLMLASGQTYGIYLTATDGTPFEYTSGANTYSNADLQVTSGAGIFYPYTSPYSPRTWNGTIYYSAGGTSAIVPSAPANATAISGNGSATVSFTPGSIGSGTLVTYWAACGIDNTHLTYATGSNSPITVTGLTNGTVYYCWALTRSTVGDSDWSFASNAVTPTAPVTPPSAPTIGTATAGNAQATVNFTPPASNGGSAITSYTVTSSPGGITKTGTTSPITVTGLTNGASYTFTVKATNSAGTGSSSAASNSVTPASTGSISGSLTTSFAGGLYGADGNMFDVKVLSGNVTINRFDLNLYATAGTVVPVRVYYKTGSYSGYETISSAWTLLGTYSVTSAGLRNPSSMVVGNLMLASGQTYGIYLTATDGTPFDYTSGANTYSNADLQVTSGAGVYYPFVALLSPRTWNGTIYYSATTVPQNYSDSWWNAGESGWGITIIDHDTSAFIQWYTYDQTGHNQKYVFSGTFSPDKCQLSGNVSQVSGPSWTLPSFDPNLVVRRTTGTGAIDFCPAGLATGTIVFNYSNVDGVTGSKQLTRLPFGDDVPHWGGVANTGAADFTDLWWNPNESGWGVSVTQHGNNLFFRVFVYDTDGHPLLFVASGAPSGSGTSFSGTVTLTTGPWFGSNPFDPNQVVRTATPGNTATLTFSDANNGVLSYTVNGVTKTKAITRMMF